MHRLASIACLCAILVFPSTNSAEDTPSKITHRLLATGGETYIRDGEGNITWRYPHATRDGWVLANGNVLLALNKDKTYPGGGVVEVTHEGKVVFEFKGTNPRSTPSKRSTRATSSSPRPVTARACSK